MLRGPWAWRDKWRLYAGAAVALTALLAVLVLVVPGGSGPAHQLLVEDPTPTATTEVTPTPDSTPQSSASAEASLPSPQASGSVTPSEPAKIVTVSSAAMLPEAYVDSAFGQGQDALVQAHTSPGTSWDPCYYWDRGQAPQPEATLSRSWSWSGEVMVNEVLMRHSSAADAAKVLTQCADTRSRSGSLTTSTLDVADGGFLVRDAHPLFIAQYAGARLGSSLVLLAWLQSGPVPTDQAPVLRALRAAVDRATGGATGSAHGGPSPQPLDALRGMISRTQLPTVSWGPELDWVSDAATRPEERILTCKPWEPGGSALATVDTPYTRRFTNGFYSDPVSPESLHVTRGHAKDVADAEEQFTACKGDRPTIPDLGDDAFSAGSPGGHAEEPTRILIRAGATFYVLQLNFVQGKDPLAVGRAVVAVDDTRPTS